MPVQNIECQIARAQLGRYLAGDGMAGEAVRQLEAHVNKCAECKVVLEQKRAELVATLEGNGAIAPAPAPISSERKTHASHLLSAILSHQSEEAKAVAQVPVTQTQLAEPNRTAVNWKAIGYAGALAAVLIAMSYMGKMNLLGGKAAEALPEGKTPTAVQSPAPISTPKAETPLATPSPSPKANVAPASATPSPTASPRAVPTASASPSPDPSKAPSGNTVVANTPSTGEPKPAEHPVQPVVTKATPVINKPISTSKPVTKPKVAVKAKPVIQAKPIVHRWRPVRRIARRNVRPAFRVRASHHAGVRVYDANGNALN